MFKKFVLVLIALFFAGSLFVAGVWHGQEQVQCQICAPEDLDFSLFWEAYNIIKDKFANSDKINEKEIVHGAISGMIDALDDPFSIFLNPQDTKKFLEDVSGRYEGVGIEVSRREGELIVVAPIKGGPADKAGIKAGDKIIKINDIFAIDISVDRAVDLIRGTKDTYVNLTIVRNDQETHEFRLRREVIVIPSLKWELKEDKIAYLKIYYFTEKADIEFKNIAREIIDSPAEYIILDVRDNPGGYLYTAQKIAGWFLLENDIIFIEEYQDGERVETRSNGNALLYHYPVVVLINKGTASGSEILAGAIKDNRGVEIIGQTSFGKGSVQELKNLRDGSAMKITIANWLTPNGTLITEKGISPDIEVLPQEDKDLELETAIEIIKKNW